MSGGSATRSQKIAGNARSAGRRAQPGVSPQRSASAAPAPVPGLSAWWISGLAVALVVAVYSPVLWSSYGFSDDYAVLMQRQLDPESSMRFLIGAGRPVTAVLDHVALGLAGDIAGLRLLRTATVLGLAAVAVGLCFAFSRLGRMQPWQAGLLASGIVVLPPFQVAAAWSILFVVPIAVAAALAASFLALERDTRTPVRFVAAVLLLTFSMLIYQPAAMFFFVLVAVRTLVRLQQMSVRDVALDLVPAAAAFLLSCAIGGIALLVGVSAAGVGGGRASLTDDPERKATWFIEQALPRALDPLGAAVITTRLVPGLLLAALIVGGLLLWLRGGVGARLTKVLLVLVLVPVSYAPNLVIAEDWASNRSRLAIMPVLAVLTFFAVRGLASAVPHLSRTGPALGALTLVVLATTANRDLALTFVVPQVQELAAARTAVRVNALGDPAGGGEITVAPANWFDALSSNVSFDEYGIPSTAQPHVPVPLVQLLLLEIGQPIAGRVRSADEGEPATIDFAVLLREAEATSPADFAPAPTG